MSPANPHESALLEDLNAPQREAVLHGHGPLLVLSGAGSGKTRVITRRVAYLVKVHDVYPWRILAVTFTNKAAREMRERLAQLLGPQANELVVSTFHSAAAQILRREAEHVGLTRSFVIYDDSDQLNVVKRAMREAGIESMQPREILHRIDQEKNAARLPEQMEVASGDERGLLVRKVYAAYQERLRAANAVDFGDLLLLLVSLFRKRPDVLENYRRRFHHVLVDEFQDTNPVQYALLKQLAPPPSANLVVVGDDDQSIYRWRGADVDNILGFPENLGPRPKALLLSGLIGCTGIDVMMILNKMRVRPDDVIISVEADQTDTEPKVYKTIHLIYTFKGKDLPVEKLQRAVSLSQEKYCGVSAMREKAAPITYEIPFR